MRRVLIICVVLMVYFLAGTSYFYADGHLSCGSADGGPTLHAFCSGQVYVNSPDVSLSGKTGYPHEYSPLDSLFSQSFISPPDKPPRGTL